MVKNLKKPDPVAHQMPPLYTTENISKNLQSFLEISPVQKEDLPSHKLHMSTRIFSD